MMNEHSRITTIDVARAMGVEMQPPTAWAVGLITQRAYTHEMGELPPKGNRRKTRGQGTHCFALYPPTWRKRIEKIILEKLPEDERTPAQGRLFDD